MAHCFRCGTPIPSDERQPRRKVPTGEWVRRDSKSPSGWTVRQRLSVRVVCRRCAGIIDRRERDDLRRWQLKLGLAAGGLLVALLLRVLGAFQ